MTPPKYISVPGGKEKDSSETELNMITICVILSFFCYTFSSITRSLQSDFTVFLPPSMQQRFQDGHISFLPPRSDLSLPSELASPEAIIILEPTMGFHALKNDAVFAVAEGIDFKTVAFFVTSLRDSGFEGDIVLSVLPRDQLAPELLDFLEYNSERGLVIYEGAVEFEESPYQYNTNNTNVYLKGLYGENMTRHSFEDPRKNRDISVARFELYWIWSRRYSPTSKILLIDVKNTYFQSGVGMACQLKTNSELHLYEGLLETREVTDKAMIPAAYNEEIFNILSKMKIIVPSATHGDARAVETYLRAMVKQFDYTQCTEALCDWAWHNYLYYFGVLQGAPSIDNITLAAHGTGSVHIVSNNEIVHTKNELNDTVKTYNPDNGIFYNRKIGFGLHSSWAIHQYDQDPTIKAMIDLRSQNMLSNIYKNSTNSPDHGNGVQPTMGFHRKEVDAIFTIGDDISLENLLLFMMSLRKTGFNGDIVLSVSRKDRMTTGLYEFLRSQIRYGLVVYEDVFTSEDDYIYSTSKVVINEPYDSFIYGAAQDDPQPARYWGVARFELFLAWSLQYSSISKILLLEADDSYFQNNPFKDAIVCDTMPELNFFKMSKLTMRFDEVELYYPELSNAFDYFFGEEMENLENESPLTPNALQGHQRAIYTYLQDMIRMVHNTKCYSYGCDWAIHNYIWYFNHTNDLQNSFRVTANGQGVGVVNTIMSSVSMMQAQRILINGDLFLNWNLKPSAVIINFKNMKKMESLFEWRKREYLSELGATMTKENYIKNLKLI